MPTRETGRVGTNGGEPIFDSTNVRLAALERYDVLDTPQEETFDRVTRMATRIFDVPMSTITFIDAHRQWFKSRRGVDACETDKSPALCYTALRLGHPLVVPDTTKDSRFSDNPFVRGHPHLRFYAGVPLRTPDGIVIGTLCVMDRKPRDFGERDVDTLIDLGGIVMDLLALREQASLDFLTGVLSRRAWKDEADRQIALARRHRHDLCGLVVDLDHFKAVNDRFGHAAGDAVLRAAAAAMLSELRATDLLGRMGGEEFAVILPHTGREGAMEVAERLRAAIAGLRVPADGHVIAISTSIGGAVLSPLADDCDALLARADGALYGVKTAGRNRCVFRDPPADESPIRRRRVLRSGRVVTGAGRPAVDCTVRRLSDLDATLDVLDPAALPDRFFLAIESEGLDRPCRVTQRRSRQLDVAFEQALS